MSSKEDTPLPHIQYELARPSQIREVMEVAPVAWVPFGALEWHGEHNPLGLDGLKAHALVRMAAQRAGGVVFPPVFWGAKDTMKFPFTFSFPPSLIHTQTRIMLRQLYDMGFRVVVMLTGHYPPSQIKMLRRAALKFNREHEDAFALGIPEMALATDVGYYGDHAAMWETSIMMAISPELVDLDALPQGLSFLDQCRKHGVAGVDPHKGASAEKGQEVIEHIVGKLSDTVTEVLEKSSVKPFENIYREYGRGMKRVFNLKKGMEVLGVSSVIEMVRMMLWTLGGGKQKK